MGSVNSFDVIVVGGGMAGVSAAYELAKEHKVLLLEAEDHFGYHATGRSAAVYIPSYGFDRPALFHLTRASLNTLRDGLPHDPGQQFLYPRGLLTIAERTQQEGLRGDHAQLKPRFPGVSWLETEAIKRSVPLLRDSYCDGAIFEPDVFDIDVSALQESYLRGFRALNGESLVGHPVQSLGYSNGLWALKSQGVTFSAPIIVNACGAWADDLASRANVITQRLKPFRRTAILVSIDAPTLAEWPVIMDTVQGCYFKPDAGLLLASPGDESLSAACDSAPEEIDKAYAAHYVEERFAVSISGISSAWSGLRTFSPDRSPVVGFSPTCEGFFWLAGQGGHGIQTAPAAARLAASMISTGHIPRDLSESGFDTAWVEPDRFPNTEDSTHD